MPAALPIREDLSASELRALARREHKGRVAARMFAIAHALDGVSRAEAARLAGMDRQALRDAVVRYNAEGVAGLYDRPLPGRPEWLSEGEQATLKAIILAGPDPRRHGCVEWTLPILCEVIAERFAKTLHPASLSRIVRRLNLSKQKTRPRHPQSNAKAQAAFKKGLREALKAAAAAHPERRLQLWFQDEARVGQKGRTAHRWWERGQRPAGLCDKRFTSAYLYAAVCPASGADFALVMPTVSTTAMSLFLGGFSRSLEPDVQAVLVLDQAGWHGSRALVVPGNITLVPLPPYSPELNPVERVWLYLRERFLSHRLLDDYDAVVQACCDAWNALTATPERLRSLTSYPWLPCVNA
ncbi:MULTISPECIES: IS630 family transposase [unclassified Azospirillum]|uniref:IS630 family transposase n=1 Tax=unclassified Azospirillum TaxID=2630922 RepID=UPI000D64AF1B|nr:MULTISPECIES: IS630 family transposase [unclassified Azospirillum]